MGLDWIGLEMSDLITCALGSLFHVIVRSVTFVSMDTLLALPMLAGSGRQLSNTNVERRSGRRSAQRCVWTYYAVLTTVGCATGSKERMELQRIRKRSALILRWGVRFVMREFVKIAGIRGVICIKSNYLYMGQLISYCTGFTGCTRVWWFFVDVLLSSVGLRL